MRFAVINNGNGSMEIQTNAYVENVIVMNPEQREEMEQALGKPILRADVLGLCIGDLYNGADWTRNADGEQVKLPVQEA